MKILNLNIENDPILGDLSIDFRGSTGDILTTIVIAGPNGSGKTTILNKINDLQQSQVTVSFADDNRMIEKLNTVNHTKYSADFFNKNIASFIKCTNDLWQQFSAGELPRMIYANAEINFNNIDLNVRQVGYNYAFHTWVNSSQSVKDINSHISSFVDSEVYGNQDQLPKTSINNACKKINETFSAVEMDVRMIGLKDDGSRRPLFVNSSGDKFEITSLSSGEKQLFIRALGIKFLNPKNSIILVDEPEISLHPDWQRLIIKVYESLGNNNQLIIATHSPLVISSAKKESLRILERNKTKNGNKILVKSYNDFADVYGIEANRVLTEIMGLSTTRPPEIENKIRRLREIAGKEPDSNSFYSLYKELEETIGSVDQDLLLIRMAVEYRKVKDNHEK
jgi:predicted ATP-binding protein involved in virulence